MILTKIVDDGIQDVTYLRDKLFAALKVPKAFMGYEKDLTGKATLAAEDIRFARTINRFNYLNYHVCMNFNPVCEFIHIYYFYLKLIKNMAKINIKYDFL